MTSSAIPAVLRHPAPESLVVRISRFIGLMPRRRNQHGIVTPQVVVGQVRATPPSINRVVAAEVFLVGENGPAEIGDAKAASPEGIIELIIAFLADPPTLLIRSRQCRPLPCPR